MSERERMRGPGEVGRGAAADENSEDSWEEELRALHVAAFPPVRLPGALRQRVAELAARHEAQAARHSASGRLRPIQLRQAVAAGVASFLLVALGLTLARWGNGQTGRSQAPRIVRRPRLDPTLPGPRVALPRAGKTLDGPVAAFSPTVPPLRRTSIRSEHRKVDDRGQAVPAPAPQFRRPPSLARVDDLVSLNYAPVQDRRRWAPRATARWGQIEARLRRGVRVQDDFVRIPFPRLVDASGRQTVAAVECYRREAAMADPRLAHEVTVQQKATALSDLCDRLRADTGIQLAAGPSVADEKVTIFCEKLPLRDVMRQLARPFGYTWLRTGKAAEYKYELVQDLRSQLLEEELRNRDHNEALLALDREMERYRKYLGLSPDEARARAQTASPTEKKLLETLANYRWGPVQMYFRLSPRDLAALRSGQKLTFSGAPTAGEQPLPQNMAQGILRSWRDQRVMRNEEGSYAWAPDPADPRGLPLTEVPEARAMVSMWISQGELGQFALLGGSGFLIAQPELSERTGKTMSSMSMDACAVGRSPAVVKPDNGAANAKLAGDPSLRARVTVRPEPSCRPAPEPRAIAGLASELRVTSADVLEALHRATGRPIVADYFTRLYNPEAVALPNQPLFEALNELADTMRLRWSKDREWLRFRSTSYYDDRLKEVPNRLLARWAAARREHGALTLDDLVEVAQLSDAQLDGLDMAEGARDCWGLAEWLLAWRMRQDLRFLAAFTPAQRQMATSATGIAFTRMSLAQQQRFISVALGSQPGQLQSLEELAGAALYVEYTQPEGFQWQMAAGAGGAGSARGGPDPGRFDTASVRAGSRAPGSSPAWRSFIGLPVVRERTREAALQAARRIEPQVSEGQLVPAELALTAVYIRSSSRTGIEARVVRATPRSTNFWGRTLLPDRDGVPGQDHP
jgi:hypothetical protein